jgi:CRISPR-associated protein (TIGR03986 family)
VCDQVLFSFVRHFANGDERRCTEANETGTETEPCAAAGGRLLGPGVAKVAASSPPLMPHLALTACHGLRFQGATWGPGQPTGSNGGGTRVRAGDDEFINPYTFVALPQEPQCGRRAAPVGHSRLAEGRLSGVLNVELTARSPLLLRNIYAEEQGGSWPVRWLPGCDEPVPYLPGSSLAGAVRSLHETIAGGCLRVFDGEFRPSYRDQVKAQDPSMRLALVEKVDERGAPQVVRLCENTVWLEAAALHRVLGGPQGLRSGARVTVTGRPERVLNRLEVKPPEGVKAGEESVLLVTDAGTRRPTRKNPDSQGPRTLKGRYFCASGKLEPDSLKVELDEDVWQRYLDAVEGTEDMRKLRAGQLTDAAKQVPVQHPNEQGERLLGYRDPARRELYEGQVIWVQPERSGGAVALKRIALSAIWRHAGGAAKARERVPQAALPCRNEAELCPSCRIFGSVDASGRDAGGEARQRAYRGHVRFGQALPSGSVPDLEDHWLPPMGTPKPGAGQFYLKRTDSLEGKAVSEQQGTPLREWGSPEAERRGPRRLRGRKRYWLTAAAEHRPYFRIRAEDKQAFHRSYGPDKQMLSAGKAVAAGSRFSAKVHFENLLMEELGGLLCALDPRLLLEGFVDGEGERPEYGLSIGGGRPLGFGSFTVDVAVAALDTAASRYLGEEPPDLDTQAAVAAFRDTSDRELRDIWKRELTKVLRLDWAPDDRVWYPPAARISSLGRPLSAEALKSSFTFWKETTGGRAKNAIFPYRQLPAAAHKEPGMKVIEQKSDGRT